MEKNDSKPPTKAKIGITKIFKVSMTTRHGVCLAKKVNESVLSPRH